MAEFMAARSAGRRRFLGGLGASWLGAALLSACGSAFSDVRAPGEDAMPDGVDGSVTYGDRSVQVGDLWLPVGEGPHGVLVLIHGGFWRPGFDVALMDPLAADAVSNGWAVWNIDYHPAGVEGGGWPGTFTDVATAVDHLITVAERFDIDVERVAVAGHSAGGHLAAWVGSRATLPAGAPGAGPAVTPIAVVSQAGVLDLVAAANQRVGGDATVALMGATPAEDPDRYALGSPIERVPTGLPVRCVHGRGDRTVPIDQSERYVEAAKSVGDPVELAPFDGDHFAILDPRDVSWTDTVDWLRRYLEP